MPLLNGFVTRKLHLIIHINYVYCLRQIPSISRNSRLDIVEVFPFGSYQHGGCLFCSLMTLGSHIITTEEKWVIKHVLPSQLYNSFVRVINMSVQIHKIISIFV